ncbi:YqiA/YcfP family alpha/beta fold hydrolase, partial [Aeromonas hydrophila]|uniref:YqiA/YcfP family alpha/beta fold hydrolase n=1 Tax=Aeromonas hydrophila TaxID=644 RepID=UPI00311ED275
TDIKRDEKRIVLGKIVDDNGDIVVNEREYWSERIGFLCGIKQVIFNPNLHPEITMQGKIDRPEEYEDIGTKCVSEFRSKNSGNCLCILSVQDEVRDNGETERELKNYYNIVWDERETHKFKNISHHLQQMKAFKEA